MLSLGSTIIRTLLMENTILFTLDTQIELVILLLSKSSGTMFQIFKVRLRRTWKRNSTIFICLYQMPAFGVLKLKWRILLSIPHYHDPLTQTKIITACMCLHNFIRDSKLYDDHFDRMERSSYIYEDSASFPGGHASSSSDGVMGALRQIIAKSLVA
ncbi:hypothetical protein QYE76_053879 [Lolium multiflorum]|uniref:DDE Tnp4 domain-containing protein n=1 Tax=Lolium multiflorum TaxID=4521 RepID=A0AAD8SXJ4_LOLMU|nr:hypothetical protein QYE76_053879 [Lolium multiflorum]